LIDNGFTTTLRWAATIFLISSEGSNGRRLVELPSDHSLDDWPQYVNMREFNMGIPTKSPAQAMEVFRADFDAAWTHGGLWATIWHPFVSGRLARAEAMVGLFEHMRKPAARRGSLQRWLKSARIFRGSSTAESGLHRSSGFRSGRSPCHRSRDPAGSAFGGMKLASLASKAGFSKSPLRRSWAEGSKPCRERAYWVWERPCA
jgi:hypothetical protein